MSKATTNELFNIELHENCNGEFYFKKKADNMEDISMSTESYMSKQMALHGLMVDTRITLINLVNIKPLLPFPLSLVYLDQTVDPAEEKVLIINEANA